MFSLLERFMIQQLRNMGITQKVIQEVTGISERTIRRTQNEPALSETNDLIFRKSRNAGRPRVVLQKLFKARAFLSVSSSPKTQTVVGVLHDKCNQELRRTFHPPSARRWDSREICL